MTRRELGTALITVMIGVSVGCNGANTSTSDTPAAVAAGAAADTIQPLVLGAWPHPDVIVIQDVEADKTQPKYKLRVQMGVELDEITEPLAEAVAKHQGHDVLKIIMPKLTTGTPEAWKTLKFALGCDETTAAKQDDSCVQVNSSGVLKPEIALLEDYETGSAVPTSALIVHMDIDSKGGKASHEKLKNALKGKNVGPDVLGILEKDQSIGKMSGHNPAWATLKAALGCSDFQSTAATC